MKLKDPPIPIPHPDKLKQDDPERWQVLNIDDASRYAHASPMTLRNWMNWGWLKEPDHYVHLEEWRTYRWDTHYLFYLARLGKKGRSKIFRTPGDPTEKKTVEDLLRAGWHAHEWYDLTLGEAGQLFGVSRGTMFNLIDSGYLERGVHYVRGKYEHYAFHMGPCKADIALWRDTHVKHRNTKNKPKDIHAKRRTKAEIQAIIDEFERGYIPPAERQDRSDVEAILIQEKAERGIARDLGQKGFLNRPHTVPIRRIGKLTGPDLGDM